MQIQMYKVWFQERILLARKFFKISSSLQEMQGDGAIPNAGNNNAKGDPRVEARYGGLSTLRSLAQRIRRTWDPEEIQGTMERLLQKQSPRKRTGEEVRERQKETNTRYARLRDTSSTQGFKYWIEILTNIEMDSYFCLRNPDKSKDVKVVNDSNGQPRYQNEWVSLDYYIGFQNGRISTVEDVKKIFSDSIIVATKKEVESETQ